MDNKIINTLRFLSIDMIEKANSGHPGMVLGCAPMMFVLWCKIMNFDPSNPLLFDRDRFILSNGHGCALLYSILYLLGYDYSMEDLTSFRQIHSKTPGHPEFNQNLGIEISTGPLGQGIANSVGMAISSKKLGLNNYIYVMCGDGCLMEGVSYEACSIAGHLSLNNLIILYDNNGITIDGKTDITFTENTMKRFEALNWNVLEVLDGDNDIDDIYNKLVIAKKSEYKPTIIFIKTTIGYGSIGSGKNSVHGTPLGKNNTELLKEYFNADKNKIFFIEDDVKKYFLRLREDKINKNKLNISNNFYQSLYQSDNIKEIINELKLIKNSNKSYASRDSSSLVLSKIIENMNNIIIGSADLGESNKTMISKDFITSKNFNGKYIHYGIREHAMTSIANGISTFNILPIISTFLVFITYCLAPIRMAALAYHKVIYVFTHDSIFLGEDGPSHQPIESLTILRSIPNLLTIRPSDVNEVSGAYQIALDYNGPTAIILSRQIIPNNKLSCMEKMKKGGYIIYESNYESNYESIYESIYESNNKPQLIIVSTGSEVSLAIDVAIDLASSMNIFINVVSMPCCEIFDLQTDEYKNDILPKNVPKLSLEAGSTIGWYKYANYTYGVDTFGVSGKINDLKEHFGFTVEKIKKFIYENIIKSNIY